MNTMISIDDRFRGPPNSGNGGIVCGLLAQYVGNPAEVTLSSPPPLNTPLTVKRSEGKVFLYDGETLVASGIPSAENIPVPEPPTFEQAIHAEIIPHMVQETRFGSTCFVCGPARTEGDGLRIFPGRVINKDCVATIWVPDASLADSQGFVKDEVIWAALDCPGAWAFMAEEIRVSVLGRMTAEILERVSAKQQYIVMGWKNAEVGRKLQFGAALFTESGRLLAKAKGVYIELKQKDLGIYG